MHTHFILSTQGGSAGVFNTVEAGYLASFGSKPFSHLCVEYALGSEEHRANLPITYQGGKYLGNGSAMLTFTALFGGKSGALIRRVGITSDEQVAVNSSEECSFVADGNVEITAVVSVRVEEQGFTLSATPLAFFEWLFGVRDCLVEAFAYNGELSESVELSVERGVGCLSISVTPAGRIDCEKIAITCDKGVVLYVDAPYVTVGTESVGAESGIVLEVEGGTEITQIAGSAVTLSEVTARRLGKTVSNAIEWPLLFSPVSGGIRNAQNDEYVAVMGKQSLTLYKRVGNGYECVNALAPHFLCAVTDCAFSADSLFVLSGRNIEQLDPATGQSLAVSQTDFNASGIFVGISGQVILVSETGAVVYDGISTLSQVLSLSLSNAKYSFDQATQTLTAFHSGGVDQYKFNGSQYEQNNIATAVATDEVLSVNGRWGYAIACGRGGYTSFDLISGNVNFHADTAESITACCGANRIAARTGDKVAVRDVSPLGDHPLFTLPYATAFHVGQTGVFSGSAFYPFGKYHTRFELPVNGEGCEFTVYKEVPYFAQETHILTFEAIL